MKIHILSDLHTEFQTLIPSEKAINDADVIVLAGDVGIGENAVRWIRYYMPEGKPILFVPGNHEYYRGDIVATFNQMRDLIDHFNQSGMNIKLLNNQAVIIDDVQFVGATLWTDYKLSGNQPIAMYDADRSMNDFRLIERNGNKIGPMTLVEEFDASKGFIQSAIDNHSKNVVITHHGPCELSIHPKYKDNPHLNASFASRLDYMFGENIPLWIHGHMHDSFDYQVAETRVICNPRGYAPRNVNPDFDADMIVEV